MPTTSPIETSVHIERHYAAREIAEMWNLSPDKVRELGFRRTSAVTQFRKRLTQRMFADCGDLI
jgi:hypothetical protein